MSMTREEAFEVFRFYASKEFEDVPVDESEIEYEFSEEFNRKMEKLLRRVAYDRTHAVSWAARKVIAVAAAIIFALAGMMSVSAIREPVVEFFYNIYEEFMEIFFEGDTTEKITYVYSLSEIPEGFVETTIVSEEYVNIIKYKNMKNGDVIELKQSITEDAPFVVDNEQGDIEKFEIDGNEIIVYSSNQGYAHYAFWIKDSYSFKLMYSGKTTVEEILKLIEKVK